MAKTINIGEKRLEKKNGTDWLKTKFIPLIREGKKTPNLDWLGVGYFPRGIVLLEKRLGRKMDMFQLCDIRLAEYWELNQIKTWDS